MAEQQQQRGGDERGGEEAAPKAAQAVTKLMKGASSSSVFLTAAETIIKYAENLQRHPDEDRFKRINLANMSFQTRVYQVPGGEDCMRAMGFAKEGPSLVLKQGDMKRVKNLETVLRAALTAKRQQEKVAAEKHKEEERKAREGPARAEMVRVLTTHLSRMRIYEQPALQAQARSCIPVDDLKRRAQQRDDKNERSTEDRLLLELLRWFKKEFFTWVDTLPCDFCGQKTKVAGMTAPLPEEARWEAGRVEVHQCQACGRSTRFPRYNHPGKLLETRRGRCGEWANCFVLCSRAMGFHTRYVLDYTDHVWAEVFSARQNKWLHCDPCENACDKPLMYERGWGKKLSYVFAFSFLGVADVIWRYSHRRQETLTRRDKVSEEWLSDMIRSINAQLLAGAPDIQREAVLQSLREEQQSLQAGAEREAPATALSAQERMGRQTGAEEWRRARGELGQKRRAEGAEEERAAEGSSQAGSRGQGGDRTRTRQQQEEAEVEQKREEKEQEPGSGGQQPPANMAARMATNTTEEDESLPPSSIPPDEDPATGGVKPAATNERDDSSAAADKEENPFLALFRP